MAYEDVACASFEKAVPAVESALSGLDIATERTRELLGELLSRLERVSGAEDPNKCGGAEPNYSCSLASDIQSAQRRVQVMGEQISAALQRLAI